MAVPTSGNDNLVGDFGDNTINGLEGDDTITGGPTGSDLLNGGEGNDSLFGGQNPDTLIGAEGNDTLNGGVGADLVVGGEDNDVVMGGSGNDRLLGGDGEDTIIGGDDDDLIFGDSTARSNNDKFADTFVFDTNDGSDVIVGFDNGGGVTDKIVLVSETGDDDFELSAKGKSTVITFGDTEILLRGVKLEDFDPTTIMIVDEFTFG